jgi:hypothetical protein
MQVLEFCGTFQRPLLANRRITTIRLTLVAWPFGDASSP